MAQRAGDRPSTAIRWPVIEKMALRLIAGAIGVLAVWAVMACFPLGAAAATEVETVAFLGVHFQNDNARLEPTTDAERHRMTEIADGLKKQMEASGKFKFVAVPGAEKEAINAGQPVGECGGCEFDYGKQVHTDLVAWIRVQKVSDLILNLNVFVGRVADRKLIFVHSVDMRGNTDESWTRSLTYLVQNYLLRPESEG